MPGTCHRYTELAAELVAGPADSIWYHSSESGSLVRDKIFDLDFDLIAAASWVYAAHTLVLGLSNSCPSGEALSPKPPSRACTCRPLSHVAFATPFNTLPW